MKFQYPYLDAHFGTRNMRGEPLVIQLHASEGYLWIDAATFTADFYWGTRWFSRDLKLAHRARCAVALPAYALTLVVGTATLTPLLLLARGFEVASAALEAAVDAAAEHVVRPFLTFAVPVHRWGVRDTFAALIREITK